jgi:hypothetical protein
MSSRSRSKGAVRQSRVRLSITRRSVDDPVDVALAACLGTYLQKWLVGLEPQNTTVHRREYVEGTA